MLAIVQCASTFEDQRKVAFSTHAYTIAERALIGRLRKATVIRRRTVRDAGVEILAHGGRPDFAAVKALASPEKPTVPHVDIPAPDLAVYDRLLAGGAQ